MTPNVNDREQQQVPNPFPSSFLVEFHSPWLSSTVRRDVS
jgi:hypothetical protein